jgi:pyruvate dehydrogenase E2 component (dihydrolipoyllysine-residue acetyltransferase)
MAEFRMPSLGADMDAGTLVEWIVKPGDRVKRGDIVAVVETQKGAIEIEIFETGRIEQMLVDVGTKVPVGTALARIRSDKEAEGGPAAIPEIAVPPAPLAATLKITRLAAPQPQIVTAAPIAGRIRASPAARRLASERGIDLGAVVGSGPLGAIVLGDVERSGAVETPPVEKKRAIGLDLGAMRAAIAAAMARSKREIPHYYLEHQVDVTGCEEFLSRINAGRQPDKRLLMGVLAVKAVASAARRFPAFNGFFQNGQFKPSTGIHAGVAIAIRGGGLAAPAIHDSDQLTLDELMAHTRDLVQRMRAGRIRSSEMADPTITVSSLGERGVEALYGIIYPPQVAIVGFGKVVVRPWVVDSSVVPRSVVTVTLAADHRVSDGHAGALFLAEIGRLLQAPDKL